MELSDFKFKIGNRDYLTAKRLLEGRTREEIIREFFPVVGQKYPWIFSENINGRREPKPLDEQRRLLIWSIGATISKMKEKGWVFSGESHADRKRWTGKERMWVRHRANFISMLARELAEKEANPEPPPVLVEGKPVDFSGNPSVFGTMPESEVAEEEKKEEPIPDDEFDEYGNIVRSYERDDGEIIEFTHKVVVTVEQKLDLFYKKMMYARSFVMQRELGGQYLDFISTRALKDGCKAIIHGIGVNEIMAAITKTWPQDSKNELVNWVSPWEPSAATLPYEEYPADLPGAHKYLGYVIRLAEARIPIFLVGPSGSGKSFLARDLADYLEMAYGELPLTAGATPSWLVGAETITGYKSRPFVDIYREGGVFCLEEMDAADPNMLLLINNALANEFLTNPVTGEEIEKHRNFIPVATANTWGLGANRQFTGRERLDSATLDRWRVGRVEMDYDEEIEVSIVEYHKNEAKPHTRKVVKATKR